MFAVERFASCHFQILQNAEGIVARKTTSNLTRFDTNFETVYLEREMRAQVKYAEWTTYLQPGNEGQEWTVPANIVYAYLVNLSKTANSAMSRTMKRFVRALHTEIFEQYCGLSFHERNFSVLNTEPGPMVRNT